MVNVTAPTSEPPLPSIYSLNCIVCNLSIDLCSLSLNPKSLVYARLKFH